jgi:hypothetical protein
LWLQRSWSGEVCNVSVLVAVGVNEEVFAKCWLCGGSKEDKASLNGIKELPLDRPVPPTLNLSVDFPEFANTLRNAEGSKCLVA